MGRNIVNLLKLGLPTEENLGVLSSSRGRPDHKSDLRRWEAAKDSDVICNHVAVPNQGSQYARQKTGTMIPGVQSPFNKRGRVACVLFCLLLRVDLRSYSVVARNP